MTSSRLILKPFFKKLSFKAIVSKLAEFKSIVMKLAATSLLLSIISVIFSASLSAHEHSVALTTGVWLTGTDGGKIETYQKDEQWFGKLVASDNDKAPIGIDILRNFTLIDGQWQGEVYSIKRQQLADAIIEPNQDRLVIEVSIAFFSKTLEWYKDEATKQFQE